MLQTCILNCNAELKRNINNYLQHQPFSIKSSYSSIDYYKNQSNDLLIYDRNKPSISVNEIEESEENTNMEVSNFFNLDDLPEIKNDSLNPSKRKRDCISDEYSSLILSIENNLESAEELINKLVKNHTIDSSDKVRLTEKLKELSKKL